MPKNCFRKRTAWWLTSATLSAAGDFEYLKRRIGVRDEALELLIGSPFDYERAAQALIPEDMPQPNANGYVPAVTDVLAQLGRELEGRTMALFTSHSSLRAVAQRLRPLLEPHGIQVLAQGVDGSAPYVMSRLRRPAQQRPSWHRQLLGRRGYAFGPPEGAGYHPPALPGSPATPSSSPVSALYDDPFSEYSVPNAILRFRQGIGRLIRNKDDRGNIVVLDSRIISHGYGKTFQNSMPPCRQTPCLTANVGTLAARWLESGWTLSSAEARRGGRRGSRSR